MQPTLRWAPVGEGAIKVAVVVAAVAVVAPHPHGALLVLDARLPALCIKHSRFYISESLIIFAEDT